MSDCRNPDRPEVCLCPLAGRGYGPRQVLARNFINGWVGESQSRHANSLAADPAVTEERLWQELFTLERDASGAMQFWRNSQ